MTREEAIAIIENEKKCVNRASKNDYCNRDCYNCELVKTDTEILTALDVAIKALEQEPCREADDYENEISDLYNHLDIVEYDKERLREEVTTLEEKLKGLSAEPCEDAISRAEVIDELNRIGRNAFKEDTDYDNFFAFLDNLPPVTPRLKMVTNTKEAETYPINEDISKGFEEFTKMMFKQGQVESEE